MRLIWQTWEQYNPVHVLIAAVCLGAAVYVLVLMGFSGPPALWLIRAIFAILALMGFLVLLQQFKAKISVHSFFFERGP